jgi:hypothetical protein
MPDGRRSARAIKGPACLVAAACVWGLIWSSATAFLIVIVWGGLAMCLVALVRRALRNPQVREIWRAWDQNPVSVYNRRLIYRFGTPTMLGFSVFFLALGQWVAGGLMLVLVGVGLEAGARTPGTRAHRLFLRLRQRE